MTSDASTIDGPISTRGVSAWLLLVYGMILAIVVVGGITRLTGSGLSMVEWRPLMGILPPLSEAEWLDVFAKYKLSPQYQITNAWMGLEDFKAIFFWEYFHRVIGRLIGAVFLFPWLYFLVRGRLTDGLAARTAVAFVLGGAQGLLGWYMVKSGLVDVPAVSHYRLAAHLGLALVVAMWVFWIWLDLRARRGHGPPDGDDRTCRTRRLAWGLFALTAVQIVFGAFVAGKRAGVMYPTFPDMNGYLMPPGLFDGPTLWSSIVDDPGTIHFIHRMLGWLILLLAVPYGWWAARTARTRDQRVAAWAILVTTVVQFALGAVTVLLFVPTWAAVSHQGVAVLLLTAALMAAHAARPLRPTPAG